MNRLLKPFNALLRRGQPIWRTTGRSIFFAAIVGIVAGLGGLAFQILSQFVTRYTLTAIAGYDQGSPPGEAHLFHADPNLTFSPLLLLIVITTGGLLSGLLVWRFAPEAEGHGTDAAIEAYHHKRGIIRPIVPIVKMFASAFTLGTGGSGGREGPIAQIGAGFGSHLATRLGLPDSHRRVLLAAGLGAGIGAIFNAPLAGAIFSIEVLYLDADFESEALIPAFIATTVAYCVFHFSMYWIAAAVLGPDVFDGFGHLFNIDGSIEFRQPLLLIPLTALVAIMVPASWIYVKLFYSTHWMFQRFNLRPWLKPALGALLTGLFAVGLYKVIPLFTSEADASTAQHDVLSVLSFGYGFLQKSVSSTDGSGLLIPVLLAVAFGKMISTSLTIGSGGSGGVFGPSMVIGGALGAVVGLMFKSFIPGIRVDVFAILGMAGFFAAAAKTPVSTLIMVTELTAGYELLLPAMWVTALAFLFSSGWTIFHKQLPNRLASPAHRGDFIVDILHGMTVADALAKKPKPFITVHLEQPLSQVVKLITGTSQTCFPVTDHDENYFGLFSIQDVRQFLYDPDLGDLALAHDLATPGDLTLPNDLDLGSAIQRFASSPFDELPVVDPEKPKKVIAMLRRQDVIAAYNVKLLQVRTEHAA